MKQINWDWNKSKYLILPYIIPLKVKYNETQSYVISPKEIDSVKWYEDFKNKVISNNEYLPICRFSDGEYEFLFNDKLPVFEFNSRFLKGLVYFLKKKILSKNFQAETIKGVSSGKYTRIEKIKSINNYKNNIKEISNNGYLALHLTFAKEPFQQKWHPSIKDFLVTQNIVLSVDNYAPFYFVYNLLSSKDRFDLFKNKNILLITSESNKVEIVRAKIVEYGASSVSFVAISQNRSLFDIINIENYLNKIDIVLLAAGIGKVNILTQLKPLNATCIDIGYMYEVYANPEIGLNRPFCTLEN